jgi:rfaE bifunctional protein nucleotidyltransferase chain/domain
MSATDVVKSIEELNSLVKKWKANGEKVVFTNGVFDILHLGHVDYLTKAKALGDRLIVAVNSDSSVKRLNKGPERPLQPEIARATIIGSLKPVDATLIFDQDTPLELIKTFLPDILVKGGDYDPTETDRKSKRYIVGAAEVKESRGAVKAIEFVKGYSTTGIVEKLKKADQ